MNAVTTWAYVIVRLRAADKMDNLELGINLSTESVEEKFPLPLESCVPGVPVNARTIDLLASLIFSSLC